MRSLLVYIKDYKKECILAPLFKMLEASFELFIPLVVASMIDKGIAKTDVPYIVRCCILLVVLAVVGLVCAITAQFFAAKAAVYFAANIRKDLFSKLMNLSYKQYDEIGTSTMITRMTSDITQVQTGVNMFLRLTLRSPFVVFGAMVMAFTVDAKSSLVFLIVIFVLFIVVATIMRTNIPMIAKVQKKLEGLLLLTRENITGVRVLRAFAKYEDEKKSYDKVNEDLYDSQIFSSKISSLMNPVTYVIINIAIAILIYVGAVRVNIGEMTQGNVVALYNYMSQILVELIKLANMIVLINKALASGSRIEEVLKLENTQKIANVYNIESDSVIEFRNVSFRYNEGGDEALTNISFNIKKGDVVGIIGGTGSGKSTLINLIPRFYDASSGNIYVEGKDVNSYKKDELRDKFAVVFQKASLFKGSIAENLRYGKKDASEVEMLEAMESAVATDVLNAKGGLWAQVGEAGRELSGGQKQRITIARALIKQPEILILDDATSALDFATQSKFIHNLKELKYEPTIIIVSQRTNAMLDADKIIVLDDGEIVGEGRHEELLASCDIYKDIHNTQFVSAKQGGAKDE